MTRNELKQIYHLNNDKDGEKRYTTDVIAERVEFIDWKEKSEADGVPEGFQQLDDDDIPF